MTKASKPDKPLSAMGHPAPNPLREFLAQVLQFTMEVEQCVKCHKTADNQSLLTHLERIEMMADVIGKTYRVY